MNKRYRGIPERRHAEGQQNPYGFEVVVEGDGEKGKWLRPLPHALRHSPDGFAWGYGGSGPSELARCLLIDVLGPCPRCGGDGMDPEIYRDMIKALKYDTAPEELEELELRAEDDIVRYAQREAARTCPSCFGEGTHPDVGFYQAFKRTHVASWKMGQPWEITEAEIREWVEAEKDRIAVEAGRGA